MLGSSPLMTIFGYLIVVFTVIAQATADQPIPNTVHGWIVFVGGIITGVGVALGKQWNRTNSTQGGTPVAHPVAPPGP